MASSIALDKIELLSFEDKYKATLNKFLVTYGLVSFDDMKKTNDFLLSKGIVVKRPSQVSVFLNDYEYIVNVVNAYEQNGDLKALQDDPKRISIRGGLERLNTLKSSGLPYINDKGKYINDPFSKTAFNSMYSSLNTAQATEPLTFDTPAEPVFSEPTSAFSEVSDDTIIINPVTEEQISQFESTNTVASPIDSTAFDSSAQTEESANDNFADTEAIDDPIAYILSKPQTVGLDDDALDRYSSLSDKVRQVLYKVYGVEEINDNIIDNLIRLIASDSDAHNISDEKLMYYAITYGKNISEEEANQLLSAIRDELEYTNIMNLNLGR